VNKLENESILAVVNWSYTLSAVNITYKVIYNSDCIIKS